MLISCKKPFTLAGYEPLLDPYSRKSSFGNFMTSVNGEEAIVVRFICVRPALWADVTRPSALGPGRPIVPQSLLCWRPSGDVWPQENPPLRRDRSSPVSSKHVNVWTQSRSLTLRTRPSGRPSALRDWSCAVATKVCVMQLGYALQMKFINARVFQMS
ncbi:hypothetical protein COCON_G00200900 [Conger conger]|uniref:Uncharacterized protein n=1 Tax=Conger conger TaxID=82655 RepID=A0A9Q1D237_CONCO|nr:hypothetical protein COCON_G00200900 [Conger conger]